MCEANRCGICSKPQTQDRQRCEFVVSPIKLVGGRSERALAKTILMGLVKIRRRVQENVRALGPSGAQSCSSSTDITPRTLLEDFTKRLLHDILELFLMSTGSRRSMHTPPPVTSMSMYLPYGPTASLR